VQCRPSRIESKLQEVEWGTTLICPFNTYSIVVVVWLGVAGVDRARVYVYHACLDAYIVYYLLTVYPYITLAILRRPKLIEWYYFVPLRKAYEFAKTQGFIPYDTCMPYLACSADSDEGFCKHVDTSCVKSNICRTCSTFASFGGTCSEVNDALYCTTPIFISRRRVLFRNFTDLSIHILSPCSRFNNIFFLKDWFLPQCNCCRAWNLQPSVAQPRAQD